MSNKIFGSDIVDASASSDVKKLQDELKGLLNTFIQTAGAVDLMRKALSNASGIGTVSDELGKNTKALDEMQRVKNQILALEKQIAVMNSNEYKQLIALREERNKNNQQLREEAKAVLNASDAYKRLESEYQNAAREAKNLGAELGTNSKQFQDAANKANLLHEKLKTIDAGMGVHTRNVGNYASATNSLSQVLREMPAFTYSAQTGILALSNNLPILADQFKAVKDQTGSTGAALKVFAGSLLSFPNILTVAIGLITVFWKDIENLFFATEKANDTIISLTESIKSQAKEITTLEKLYAAATDVALSMSERKKAVDELQRIYPDYFANLKDEEILANNAKDAYDRLTQSLKDKAFETIKTQRLEKLTEDLVKLQERLNFLTGSTDKNTFNYSKESAFELQQLIDLKQKEIDMTLKSMNANKAQHYDEIFFIDEKSRKEYLALQKKQKNETASTGAGRTGGGRGGRNAVAITAQKNIIDEQKRQFENEKNLLEQQLNDQTISYTNYYLKLDDLATKYRQNRKGLKDKELDDEIAFNTKLSEIQAESHKKILELLANESFEAAKAGAGKVNNSKKTEKDITDNIGKHTNIRLEFWRSLFEYVAKKQEEKKENQLKTLEQINGITSDFTAATANIFDIQHAKEMAQIDEKEKANQAYYDEEEERIKIQFTNKAQRERELAKLEAERAAQEKAIERERIRANIRRAQQQKSLDIANIITTTSLAVMGALSRVKTDGPTAYIQAAAIGIKGASEIAKAIATPIPEYKEGTGPEGHKGGLAVIGDGGVPEYVEEPGKKGYWSKPFAHIVDLPAKTKVTPPEQLLKNVMDNAMTNLGRKNIPVNAMNYQEQLISEFESMTAELKATKEILKRQRLESNIHIDFNHELWVNNNIR
jgi:hypothetical protein